MHPGPSENNDSKSNLSYSSRFLSWALAWLLPRACAYKCMFVCHYVCVCTTRTTVHTCKYICYIQSRPRSTHFTTVYSSPCGIGNSVHACVHLLAIQLTSHQLCLRLCPPGPSVRITMYVTRWHASTHLHYHWHHQTSPISPTEITHFTNFWLVPPHYLTIEIIRIIIKC